MSRVEAEVRRRMEKIDRPGLVAVSGGPDSAALLRALVSTSPVPFTVVHVNHKLRGDESEGDETFVAELASKNNVSFRSVVRPIPVGDSVEDTARDLRYDWFREMARELDSGWIATGHTADDQAETVLHRIIRGTGLHGLRGLEREREDGLIRSLKIVRPMLTISRADVISYLSEINQEFREDSSNVDLRYTRNRIRHDLLPILRSFNPQVSDSLCRLARQADETCQVLHQSASELLTLARLPPAGETLVYDATLMAMAGDARIRDAFRLLWDLAALPAKGMTADHWQQIVDLIRGNTPAGDFPGGISIRRVGKVVQLQRKS